MLTRPTHRAPTFRSRRLLALLCTLFVGLALGVSQAGASGPPVPEPCSQPPSVVVDQSDPAFSTITIAVSCQAEAHVHKIVTATVGGVEVLRVDTLTDITADATHVTQVTIPKAQVCVSDPDTGDETCLP